MPRTDVRKQILDAAARLFYRHGVNGVGIDVLTGCGLELGDTLPGSKSETISTTGTAERNGHVNAGYGVSPRSPRNPSSSNGRSARYSELVPPTSCR